MLLKFSEMERRYGGHKYPKIESYETLKAQGVLLDWDYTPPNAKIIYVSHEWVANKHADPRGVHVRVLLNVLRRLKQGKIDEVDIDMRIKISRGTNLSLTTTREEWMKFLSSDTYIWFDWCCVPQNEKQRRNALRSTFDYVKRADLFVILAPGVIHADRIDPLTKRKMYIGNRSWRVNARCVLEMFCSLCTDTVGKGSALLIQSESELDRPM